MNTETILAVIDRKIAATNSLIERHGDRLSPRTLDVIGDTVDTLRDARVAFETPSPTLGRGDAVGGITDTQYRRYFLRAAVQGVRSVKRRVAKDTKRVAI